MIRSFGASILLFLWLAVPGLAHDFQFTQVVVVLSSDGRYQADISADVDALALGLDPSTDSAIVAQRMASLSAAELRQAMDRARATFAQRTQLYFDGQAQQPDIAFPQHGTPAAQAAQVPTVLGTLARLTGRIPSNASELTFWAAEEFKVVHLTIFDPAQSGQTFFTLEPGETSPPYLLGGVSQPAQQNVFWRYTVLGFEHILPKGVDHILFVLGLFLLSTRFKALLWQITAFTVAHSVTLALSMFDVISLPSRLVESLIALSIAYVAVDNVLTSELKPWRPAVVFVFGLLHGMGFAGVLRELGLPRDQFVPALIAFNVGVELGQLSVVALALASLGRFRSQAYYRKAIVIPASLAIAAVGLYWAFERAFL
jgi:hypothetical protein